MRKYQASARRWFLGLLVALAAWGSWVSGAPPAEKPEPPEKTYEFNMSDKPWRHVIEWLADETNTSFVGNMIPTGTLKFIAPRGKKKYTLGEIVDILNEAMVAQKYYLIRKPSSFTIVAADEKIDPAWVPKVELKDIPKYGDSELIKVQIPLNSLVAEELAPEVKELKGPFGEVVALKEANQLYVLDTTKNIRSILKTIHEMEDKDKVNSGELVYKCKYIKARDAAEKLTKLLGNPLDAQPQQRMNFRGGDPRFAPPQAAQPAQKIRMHYITSDDRLNTVMVTGPANKVAEAKSLLLKMDVQGRGQQPIAIGEPFLKTYKVKGNADSLVKALQAVFKPSESLSITAVGKDSITVWAAPQDQIDIQKQIEGNTESNKAEAIPLRSVDAAKAVEVLQGMFPDAKNSNPFIGVDPTRNAVIVKGSEDQVAQVKDALKALGELGAQGGNVRTFTLEQGSASNLAEALNRLLPQMLNNPVKVITPNAGKQPVVPRREGGDDKENKEKKKENKSEARAPRRGLVAQPWQAGRPVMLAQAPRRRLVDPQEEKKKADANKRGKAESPVLILASGDKLIIRCDDPEAMALIQDLVRLMTQAPKGGGDFSYIPLRNADAAETAKFLDAAFNGTKQDQGNQGGFPPFFGGRFGRFGAQMAPSNPTPDRVRVVADTQTNALLVRASPVDMISINNLLEKIDRGGTESTAVVKQWPPIRLKYASAYEVADTVEDVFRQATDDTPRGGGFRSAFIRSINAQTGKKVSLSVGVDGRSNSIIVSCPEGLYQDIKKLAMKLDEYAKEDKKTFRVLRIEGIDPALVQQALDALQGIRSSTPLRSTGSIFDQGGGGGGGPTGGRGGRGGRGGLRSNLGPPGPSPGGPNRRGRDFFAQGVTDDPQLTSFYDPQQPDVVTYHKPAQEPALASAKGQGGEAKGGAEEQEQAEPPARGTDIAGPRGIVRTEALPDLGVIIVSGQNPADVEAAIRIIQFIVAQGAAGDIVIQLVPLEYADATSVASTLSVMFQRVIVGPASNTRAPLTQRAPAAPAAPAGGAAAPAGGGPGGGGGGRGGQFNQAAGAPAPTGQPGQPQQTQQQIQLSSVTLIPLPRFNAILMAAPRSRVRDIMAEIKRLDRKNAPQGSATAFSLKRASAARVATLLTQFYASRYPNETAAQHQVRFTYDETTNTLYVQAAPADMEEIKELIERIDSTASSAISDMRIVPLRNAIATDLTSLILQAISAGVATTSPTGAGNVFPAATPTVGATPGAFGAAATPGAFGAAGGRGGAFGTGGAGAAGAPAPTIGTNVPTAPTGITGPTTKYSSLRFFSTGRGLPPVLQAGHLEDVRITPDPRTNSLIIAAPETTMPLLLALVRELDIVPNALAQINIFTLRKADAAAVANTISQLFLGTTGTATPRSTTPVGGPTGTGAAGTPFGGAGTPFGAAAGGTPFGAAGAGPGLPGAVGAAAAAIPGAAGGVRPLQLTLGGYTPEGAPLIELRLTVDERTNSIIVAGSRNDLDVIEAIVSRLEDAPVEARRNEVYKLKNAVAADVAAALNDFLTRSLTVYSKSSELTPFQEIQRDVVISYEPISNTLLISATPEYYDRVMRLIQQLDALPPQVVIQVLIAEVDLTGTEEFGVELGLQSPVLFQRGILPTTGVLSSSTVTISNPSTGTSLTAPGVTVSSTGEQTATPGFNFNNVNQPLPNSNITSPGIVGFQGLSNLGVGRVSPTSGVGGFVFSAGNQDFNLLIRALKTQGRMDILSRPQVMAMDNQTAFVQVGSRQPYVANSTISALGNVVNTVNYQNVGIILNVTPKINPDGTIVMRVDPQVSSVVPSTVNLGNGVFATAFNIQEVQTTVVAGDGETVAIGGMISSLDEKTENKVPWVGDLPYLGALFRYRTQSKRKQELLVILTPHIVRSRAEADRILAEESRRMDWCLGDIIKTHGTSGMEPTFGLPSRVPDYAAPPYSPPPYVPPASTAGTTAAAPARQGPTVTPGPAVPQPQQPQQPGPGAPGGREILPPPRPVNPNPNQGSVPISSPPDVPVHNTVPIPPPDLK